MGIRMFQQVCWFVFLEGHQPLVLIILDFLEDSFFFMKNGRNPINALEWLEYWTRLSLWKYWELSLRP